MDAATWQANEFEQHRAHLRSVAYRMLGSAAEADDAVQEAWQRLGRSDADAIENLRGWLTTVVGRVCIDMLRSRKSRREEYAGVSNPRADRDRSDNGGPQTAGPEDQAILADSVGLAVLVVLETLTPPERLAFVLHDMFGVAFDEIAQVLNREPASARKLASRARRKVRGANASPDPDLGRQRRVAAAFLAAARDGDFDALLDLLHPEVVFLVDAGSVRRAAPALLEGSAEVARQAALQGPRFASLCRLALVNGAIGILAEARSGPIAVAGITVVEDQILRIDLVLDPEKVRAATSAR
ncbi:sigma-70 family RNA polymerase sigma factor [Nocardioides sp. NPDC051685]|uniref:sigma-70 family RNA polymerase sigma factor n=1 Tax=Nocardioides sp. NPDC051685 TaxID=3364334 RepID=UPI0037A337B2